LVTYGISIIEFNEYLRGISARLKVIFILVSVYFPTYFLLDLMRFLVFLGVPEIFLTCQN